MYMYIYMYHKVHAEIRSLRYKIATPRRVYISIHTDLNHLIQYRFFPGSVMSVRAIRLGSRERSVRAENCP